MSLLLIAPERAMGPWKNALLAEAPNLEIGIWPAIDRSKRVQFAVCWNQPAHVLDDFPNIKAISSLGAGVDHLLRDETIDASIPVCRVVSESLLGQMKEYILSAILNYQRNTTIYIKQSESSIWKTHENKDKQSVPVGVMGLGQLGKPIAAFLAGLGYNVFGWSRSEKQIHGVNTFAGPDALESFISHVKVLICLLPLTAKTRDIIDLDVFKSMRKPGYLINVARGEHVVDEDLIYALDKNWLTGACLDVFCHEPLPENHLFWNRPGITITPHVASVTDPKQAAAQIVENYKRATSGLPLKHKVDRTQGY